MLSIGKLGSGQETYYLEKVAEGAEDYYSGRGEAEGEWIGQAAAQFDLEGKVEADQLTAMLTGRDPTTGEPLGLKSAPGREPVPGFDLTFSAPKSVSLTWALGGHPVSGQVMEAHRAAVEAALSYMERSACWARRGKGGRTFVAGQGFLAAAYVHRSSRAGDPQLHTHVLVANATLGPDGRWSRLYHPAIYEHARTASYLYAAHLRHELTQRLGVEWEPLWNGLADIRGFSAEELRAFSTRRAEILAAVGDDASSKAMRVAALETRQAKDRDITDESMREGWRVRAEEIGLTRERVCERLGHDLPGRSVLTTEQVGRSVTGHASHFDRCDAIRAVAENLPHGAPAHEVEGIADAFLAGSSVIRIAETPRGPRFTTERIWELERRALATAEEMVGATGRAVADPIVVSRVLATRSTIKSDQRSVVERLTRGGEALVLVVGEAGTGKTFATVAAAEAWAGSGIPLRVAAPTWRAANVLRSEGLDATSVARLLAELDDGRRPLGRGSVLLVDEAGMVDTANLARLIGHVHEAEAKLVLIGDPAQLGEIEAGGLFATLASRTDPVRLDQVVRHNHDLDREGARRIREGHGGEAIEVYRSEGRVVVSTDPEGRREEMVSDWWRSYREGEDALMIAKRNAEVGRLNALARAVMKADGRLGGREVEVGEATFAVGDRVITRVNDQPARIYNRERWLVESVDPEGRGVVLAAIDAPGRRAVLDADYLGRVNPSDGSPALQHAYAATTYQAQGSTVDRAYVMADSSMNRQEIYVAASRSREETWFYATPEVDLERAEYAPHTAGREGLDHIAAAAERDGAQVSAHDQALRMRLEGLSSPELMRLRHELASEAGAERRIEQRHSQLDEATAAGEAQRARFDAERAALGERPRWGRDAKHEYDRALALLDVKEAMHRRAFERDARERAELPPESHDARAEVAVIDGLLDRRRDMALSAARISAPDHIVAELGERPVEGRERAAWDGAVRDIEGFRLANGIRDRDSALGPEPDDRAARVERIRAQDSIGRAQRELGIEGVPGIERGRAMEIEL
ncbi:MAG: relaxase domain-containing protein [Actinobacteria bacterium]|nr:relaxase domain-containing protein [Actinomycetota bacterium]